MESNSLNYNKSNYLLNSSINNKIPYNENNNISYLKFKDMKDSQILIQEMQTSIDSIFYNLRKTSPSFNISKNINKGYLYKTPNHILPKQKFYNNKTPDTINYNYRNHFNNNFTIYGNKPNKYFRNYSECKVKDKLLNSDNMKNIINKKYNSEFNKNNNNNLNQKNFLSYYYFKELKIIKKINNLNKSEIINFQKEFKDLIKIIHKNIEGYIKIIKKNIEKIQNLETELNEYKTKYNNLLNSNSNNNINSNTNNDMNKNIAKITNENNIKERNIIKKKYEIEYNNKKKEEIKDIPNKYEEKNEKLNKLIIKLNLENKKLLNQINKNKEINNKNDNELRLNNKIISKNIIMKSPIKTSVSDEDFSQEKDININYNKIMIENKELKSKIAILESSQNNFMKLYFKYKEISDNLTFDNKKLAKERDGKKKKKAELNNEINIIKMNNNKINNIKIRNNMNNILINNNLDRKTKINNSINKCDNNKKNSNSKNKNNKKENMKIKNNKISSNDNLNIINFKRSKSEKNTIKLNKNNNLQKNIKGKIKIIKNSNNKKFPDLICQNKVIEINYRDEKEKNGNHDCNIKKNNSNFDNKNNENEIEKKYTIIIEKLESEIKKKEQYITKYELEKQIAEKNKKAILDSNSYQINGLNELIKLLKDKNQKLNVENEKLRNKEDERIIELIKELNYKDKEISSLNSIINKLKKELNNNGIDYDN